MSELIKKRITPYMPIIRENASMFHTDVALICSLIAVESAGIQYAIRFEPNIYASERFHYSPKAVKPRSCSLDTEKMLQSCSFGLMQLMGFNARALGFDGWLTKLLEPDLNIYYGTYHFHKRCQTPYNDFNDAIAAYNAGSPRKASNGQYVNQTYVNLVKDAYSFFSKEIKYERL